MNEVNLNLAQTHILSLLQSDFGELIRTDEYFATIFNELCFEWIKLQTIHESIKDLSSERSQYSSDLNRLLKNDFMLNVLLRNREKCRVRIRSLYNELIKNFNKLNKPKKREQKTYDVFFNFIKRLNMEINSEYPSSELEF